MWATGYNVTFPFLAIDDLTPKDNTFPLFKRMVKPGFETLFFLGLAQPLPTLVNFAEQQSKLVAAAIDGRYAFPDAAEMAEVIVEDEQEHLGHFYDSPRHRMQVDFNTYVADLAKEIDRRHGTGRQPVAGLTRRRTARSRSASGPVSGPDPTEIVADAVVVVTGVDPVTFRFSGGRSAD